MNGKDSSTEKIISLPSLSGDSIRVVSYNMLFEKSLPDVSSQRWFNRIKVVENYITNGNFDIIGSQEALTYQVDQLLDALPNIGRIGGDLTYGDTLHPKSENEAIFYNKEKFDALKSGDVWFSKTPDVPGSYSWDATYPRKITWAQFKVKRTGTIFYVFNTQFYVYTDDYEAKMQCAYILNQQIGQVASNYPIIITGDFNSQPENAAISTVLSTGLVKDSRVLSPIVEGPVGTYHGFDTTRSPTARIDYVLVNNRWDVLKYRVIDNELKTGNFGSDHLPVVVDVKLK